MIAAAQRIAESDWPPRLRRPLQAGFNLAIITIGLKSPGISDQATAYSIWLKAFPLEFFSLVVIAITFLSMFHTSREGKRSPAAPASHTPPAEAGMTMDAPEPVMKARLVNLSFRC